MTERYCKLCDGSGSIRTGIAEASESSCLACEGTGYERATPADHSDAYAGAREDLAIWKKRALEAEELNRKFMREINGPTFMGEPADHIAAEKVDADSAPVAWIRMDHLRQAQQAPFMCRVEPEFRKGLDLAPFYLAAPQAPQPEAQNLRDETIEAAISDWSIKHNLFFPVDVWEDLRKNLKGAT